MSGAAARGEKKYHIAAIHPSHNFTRVEGLRGTPKRTRASQHPPRLPGAHGRGSREVSELRITCVGGRFGKCLYTFHAVVHCVFSELHAEGRRKSSRQICLSLSLYIIRVPVRRCVLGCLLLVLVSARRGAVVLYSRQTHFPLRPESQVVAGVLQSTAFKSRIIVPVWFGFGSFFFFLLPPHPCSSIGAAFRG